MAIPAPDDPRLKAAFAPIEATWGMTEDQVLKQLETSLDSGLSSAQVDKKRAKYGANTFPAEAGTPLWLLILKQFQDTLVLILIGAAVVGLVLAFFEEDESERLTAFVEPAVIVLILIANATVGVLQENSAEAAVEALKAYEAPSATVLRNKDVVQIDAVDLVPGDVVDVEVGDLIPADLRVLRLYSTTVDIEQAALTGESEPVKKVVEPLKKADMVQDKRNLAFAGTVCVRGKFRGVVIGTGLYTEKGRIRDALKKPDEEESTPLKKRLDKFGEQLSISIGIICVIVWAINIKHFNDPALGGTLKGAVYYFKIAVSLAVAAIPEGLPAVVTTCLALGTQRMAARNAIVCVLPAVETLGCCNVICSDKTGTLTTNQMSVQRFFVLDANAQIVEFDVEGTTYAPFKPDLSPFAVTAVATHSALSLVKGQAVDNLAAKLPAAQQLARISALCNDANITLKDGKFDKIGQATEAALKVLVEKIGADSKRSRSQPHSALAVQANTQLGLASPKVMALEFTRDRKSMGVLVKNGDSFQLLVKGAWDNVLARCTSVSANGTTKPLTAADRKKIGDTISGYCTGANSYRCLALATVDVDAKTYARMQKASPEQFVDFEQNLTFVGCTAILDPPRDGVREAIQTCKEAGIRVIVITGDNIDTATAICRKIGVFDETEDTKGKAFQGVEFRAMTPKKQLEAVLNARLFARVEPIDKKTMVQLLHKANKIVAMTGDGVNDAPALSEADIGLAMGSGTAVAKGAAKVVLADDSFATITAAIEEGRCIYNNTKQFIRYLICSNVGEVVAIFVTAVTGLPEVLLPVQLLWVNLVTDGLPAVALGFNPAEEGIMKLKPRPHDEPLVTGFTFFRYIITGTYIGLATVFGSIWWFMFYQGGPKLSYEQLFGWSRCVGSACDVFEDPSSNTMSLSVLVTIEMFQALNSLSDRQSLLSATGNPLRNPKLLVAMSISFALHFVILYVPFLAGIFSVEPLNLEEWKMVVLLSAPVILLDEIIKLFMRIFPSLGASKESPTKIKHD